MEESVAKRVLISTFLYDGSVYLLFVPPLRGWRGDNYDLVDVTGYAGQCKPIVDKARKDGYEPVLFEGEPVSGFDLRLYWKYIKPLDKRSREILEL